MATPLSFEALQARLEHWRREGEILAGSLTQLTQRASVYRHIYQASGGNHIFPLIAAHGALWARGYFTWALALGKKLSWQYALQPEYRLQQLAALDRFADAFRDVNRRVCADTYANFHFTAEHGEQPAAAELVAPELLAELNSMHAAERAGRKLTTAQKQAIFSAHFYNEQKTVVGPALQKAVDDFQWPLVKFIALKPLIRFAYFPAGTSFWFHNFANREERIERGLQAFQVAADVGFERVEAALRKYQMLPEAFFTQPVSYFESLRQQVLAG
ncbi:hypothetical protein [Anatilimnocola floriformis]|uniref:hypothetical protein n=1 Tax=Anatilimnocola floriformis TaxID=2948575 RepID=UPI0020C51E0C|nr:hypothetical protein [Anatilimnocola floriformis]